MLVASADNPQKPVGQPGLDGVVADSAGARPAGDDRA